MNPNIIIDVIIACVIKVIEGSKFGGNLINKIWKKIKNKIKWVYSIYMKVIHKVSNR